MKTKTIKMDSTVTSDEFISTMKRAIADAKEGETLFITYYGPGMSSPNKEVKERKSLLIKFRWPIFVVILAGALTAGIAFNYGNSDVALYGFLVTLFGCCVAVVLNTIDETENRR